jgi:hypothetical protein
MIDRKHSRPDLGQAESRRRCYKLMECIDGICQHQEFTGRIAEQFLHPLRYASHNGNVHIFLHRTKEEASDLL